MGGGWPESEWVSKGVNLRRGKNGRTGRLLVVGKGKCGFWLDNLTGFYCKVQFGYALLMNACLR